MKKNWELAELENDLFLSRPFWIFLNFFFWIFFSPIKNNLAVHMRYHLFLHYGWFLKNLGKDFIPTNMHTTVDFLIVKKLSRTSSLYYPNLQFANLCKLRKLPKNFHSFHFLKSVFLISSFSYTAALSLFFKRSL